MELINLVGLTHTAWLTATAVFLVACGADFSLDEKRLQWDRIAGPGAVELNRNGLLENNCNRLRDFLIETQQKTANLNDQWFVSQFMTMLYHLFM